MVDRELQAAQEKVAVALDGLTATRELLGAAFVRSADTFEPMLAQLTEMLDRGPAVASFGSWPEIAQLLDRAADEAEEPMRKAA